MIIQSQQLLLGLLDSAVDLQGSRKLHRIYLRLNIGLGKHQAHGSIYPGGLNPMLGI